jgi:hypothetical protein
LSRASDAETAPVLQDVANALPPGQDVRGGQFNAIEANTSRVGMDQTEDDAEQGGLPQPLGPISTVVRPCGTTRVVGRSTSASPNDLDTSSNSASHLPIDLVEQPLHLALQGRRQPSGLGDDQRSLG